MSIPTAEESQRAYREIEEKRFPQCDLIDAMYALLTRLTIVRLQQLDKESEEYKLINKLWINLEFASGRYWSDRTKHMLVMVAFEEGHITEARAIELIGRNPFVHYRKEGTFKKES